MMKRFLLVFCFISFSGFAQITPPPPGCNPMYALDYDNDGFAQFDISIIYQYILGFAGNIGFDLSGYTMQLYPSEFDRDNGINAIPLLYTNDVANFQYCYLDLMYTGTGPEYNQGDLLYYFSCWPLATVAAAGDEDNDSVANADEDLNGNTMLIDDNTDGDDFFDFMDNDDDNDDILTVNEDYNGNGNPMDDDTNQNDIPDFREASVALHIADHNAFDFSIYPNPAHDVVNISFGNEAPANAILRIYDGSGKLVEELAGFQDNLKVSGLQTGIYFLKLQDQQKVLVRKLVIL